MLGFRRRHSGPSFFSLILAFLGLKSLLRHRHMTDEERDEQRAKGKAFRAKLREAWAVWDEKPETVETTEDQKD